MCVDQRLHHVFIKNDNQMAAVHRGNGNAAAPPRGGPTTTGNSGGTASLPATLDDDNTAYFLEGNCHLFRSSNLTIDCAHINMTIIHSLYSNRGIN
jgi:hypothetical protein